MQITAVDSFNDLFHAVDVFPQHIVDAVLNTDWINLPWCRQEGQESWPRRRIINQAIAWADQWDRCYEQSLPVIEQHLGRRLQGYQGTAWWLDEPGFTCAMHTDGEMPGAMQLTWIGADSKLGTTFYHFKKTEALRYQFPMQPNSGYIMLNTLDSQGFRHLQWHAMLTPVPKDTFRLCSYSWLTEKL